MAKIWMTSESSSFARSFNVWCKNSKKHDFINSLANVEYDYYRTDNRFMSKEVDLFDQALKAIIERSGAEIIIHQLPISPDKSSISYNLTLEKNILGSQCLIDAAKRLNIPIIFITTRNYGYINESTSIYDITASAVESLLDASSTPHMSIVPPIIYGPLFDEGISGLLKSSLNKRDDVIINMDIDRKNNFMHVDDFFDALSFILDDGFGEDGISINKDVVSIDSNDHYSLTDIIDMLYEKGLEPSYRIDYNNIPSFIPRPSAKSFQYEWEEKYNIESGIDGVLEELKRSDNKRKE